MTDIIPEWARDCYPPEPESLTDEDLLDAFDNYWTKRGDNGEVSDMSRPEKMAVEIFVAWLMDCYTVTAKP